jgi:hypothetical protein
MKALRLLWKTLPQKSRHGLLQGASFFDQRYFSDVLNQKPFPAVYHEKRCIQIHIPKCAGSSLARSVFGNNKGGHHASALWYKANFPDEFMNYYMFSMVRNPWDRLVSAWNYVQQDDIPANNKRWGNLMREFGDFNTFVKEWLTEENSYRFHHFTSQSAYLCDDMGVISLDYVGRVETIEADFKKICTDMNIKNELKSLNVRRANDYREYYTDETAEIVKSVYRQDVKLLGYTFDGFTDTEIRTHKPQFSLD